MGCNRSGVVIMSGKVLVLAGQGAQSVGMGRELAEAHPECRALFQEADEVLGYGLSKICFEGPDPELTRSDRCQPAIFVTSVACHAALRKQMPDLAFSGMAGLSLGEWSALHLAGVLSFRDALKALEARGRFMQEACQARAGGMVSVLGLSTEALQKVCADADVEMANINSGEQVVLSGELEAVKKAEQLAIAAGAKKTIMLNVAGAFHSRLMAPAAEKLAEVLQGIEFRAPSVPVVANVTGLPHGDPASIRRTMLQQITQPVKWLQCIEWFRGQGAKMYVECGPGRVLSSLIKRIDSGAAITNIQDSQSLAKAVEAIKAVA